MPVHFFGPSRSSRTAPNGDRGAAGDRLIRLADAGLPVLPGFIIDAGGASDTELAGALVELMGDGDDPSMVAVVRWAPAWPSEEPALRGLTGPVIDQPSLRTALSEVDAAWVSPPARAARRAAGRGGDDRPAITVQAVTAPGGAWPPIERWGVAMSHDPGSGQRADRAAIRRVDGGPADIFDAVAGGYDRSGGLRAAEALDLHPLDQLGDLDPAVGRQLTTLTAAALSILRGPVVIEVVAGGSTVWLLDAGPAPLRARAACRAAVSLHADPTVALSTGEAVRLISVDHVDEIVHPQLDDHEAEPIAVGLGASPGAAVGQVCFSADAAVDAYDDGHDVILVAEETTPEDVHGMEVAEGILTTRGGLASHAAVVARGWGKPAVCGAGAITLERGAFRVGDLVVREGDVISLDGATGHVYLGRADIADHGDGCPELDQILTWADEVRAGQLEVRANADTAADAEVALGFGAEGIGLCRTEHQFLGERLPVMRRLILAADRGAEQEALAELERLQQADFESLLVAMGGRPVTIRLLDPPLHEFLPDPADVDEPEAAAVVSSWSEQNPMLGTRGVRLGILKADLYRMQARAVVAAAERLLEQGRPVQVEIMVPLVINDAEMRLVRGWCEDEIERQAAGTDLGARVAVGTMIETPRAALCAAEIAVEADFFSFGTNDLTQMTLGFSRDDVEARLMSTYLDLHLLAQNPFQSLDIGGVGRLVERAVVEGRAANAGLKVGVCGEHGADASSIAFFYAAGVDYVSCSPYRVPRARLAAAQAVLAAS